MTNCGCCDCQSSWMTFPCCLIFPLRPKSLHISITVYSLFVSLTRRALFVHLCVCGCVYVFLFVHGSKLNFSGLWTKQPYEILHSTFYTKFVSFASAFAILEWLNSLHFFVWLRFIGLRVFLNHDVDREFSKSKNRMDLRRHSVNWNRIYRIRAEKMRLFLAKLTWRSFLVMLQFGFGVQARDVYQWKITLKMSWPFELAQKKRRAKKPDRQKPALAHAHTCLHACALVHSFAARSFISDCAFAKRWKRKRARTSEIIPHNNAYQLTMSYVKWNEMNKKNYLIYRSHKKPDMRKFCFCCRLLVELLLSLVCGC